MKTVMENQDKLYQQFKDASGKAEDKGFDRMEAVWNRVEEKLDNSKQRKIAVWWKYTGIAALFLLFIGIGTFMFKNENNPIVAPKVIPENNVTVIDTQKVKQTFNPEIEGFKQEVVTNEPASRSKVEQLKGDIPAASPPTENGTEYMKEKDDYTKSYSLSKKMKSAQANNTTAPRSKQKAINTTVESPFDITVYGATLRPSVVEPDKKGDIVFQGTITDKAGMSIPGVIVVFDGTKEGVQTDFDGKFTLNVNEGDKIALSYMGMEPQSVIVGRATNNTTFIMNDSNAALADVVVEGYRSTAKTMSNVAVPAAPSKAIENSTTIKGSFEDSKLASNSLIAEKKIEKNEIAKESIAVTTRTIEGRPNMNIVQMIESQIPGLNVTTGSGQPGSSPSVMLRGYSSANNYPEPLYIIDGKVLDSYIFKKINPNDIIDVQILKDAGATAIYGDKGINGVIIVKTKKPFTKRELRKFKKEKENFEKEKAKSSQE
jgi:Ca-activated chloride channel family protein